MWDSETTSARSSSSFWIGSGRGSCPRRHGPGRLGERGVKRLLMGRFPFSVVFVVTGEHVVVLALAHHRRKPNYWRDRLKQATGR